MNKLSTLREDPINQRIVKKLVDREIYHCLSSLMFALSQNPEALPDYADTILDAWESIPDYEDAGLQNGWIKTDTGFINGKDNTVSDAETWEELCDQEEIEMSEYTSEIFEHWGISEFLAKKLRDQGEKIIENVFDFNYVWCRTTTGQSICMDAVMYGVAADMGILVGQLNSWE